VSRGAYRGHLRHGGSEEVGLREPVPGSEGDDQALGADGAQLAEAFGDAAGPPVTRTSGIASGGIP
jgi:hypothetical protein